MYIILCTIVLFLFNVFNKREINPIIVKGLTISFKSLVILILYTTLGQVVKNLNRRTGTIFRCIILTYWS